MGTEVIVEEGMRSRKTGTSRRLKGSEEDSGKWYKCWNCGFPFDITKVSTGSGNSKSYADVPADYLAPVSSGDPKAVKLYLDTYDTVGCLILNKSDGDPETAYYTPRVVTVTGGCPMCGCRNLP